MEDQLNIVTLEGVSKNYPTPSGPYPVLNGISYRFAKGSYNIILGQSGSGKTTLLKLIGGLLQPTKGQLFFKDRPLHQLNFSELAQIRREHFGFMFQEAGLLEHLTCAENIAFPRLGDPGKEITEIAGYFGISHCLDKYPAHISLGERQRVCLARALAGRPECVIADEPTANLDWDNASRSVELLREYAGSGTTIFMATHDERFAEKATNVLRIVKGELYT
jgi:putative ABC transport system ATP-binding protein